MATGLKPFCCLTAAGVFLCGAQSVRAISIGTLDVEMSVGSYSHTSHDSYAWPYAPPDPNGQSCSPTPGGVTLGGRSYSGYNDPFNYQVSGSIAFSSPDVYTIDVKVWADGNLLLPSGVMGSDGFPLDKITLYIGGQGLGDRDGNPDLLNPDLNSLDDHFKVISGSYFRAYSSTTISGGSFLAEKAIDPDPAIIAGWTGSRDFNASNVRLLLFRLRIQEAPEPATAALLSLAALVIPRRRTRRLSSR